MSPEDAQAEAERDQLWANLRGLRAAVEQLAACGPDGSERGNDLARLLARIVLAELDHRAVRGD